MKFEYMFNIHFSYLPSYKGCWNSIHPILNGDDSSGVTLHLIDQGIDTGDIVDQIKFDIDKEETSFSLYEKFISNGIVLFSRNILGLISGNFSHKPQPVVNSSYYSRNTIKTENLEINVRMTWEQIDRHVRAFSFPVYQVASFEGRPVYNTSIVSTHPGTRFGLIAREGEVHSDVQCIDAVVRLWHRPSVSI